MLDACKDLFVKGASSWEVRNSSAYTDQIEQEKY